MLVYLLTHVFHRLHHTNSLRLRERERESEAVRQEKRLLEVQQPVQIFVRMKNEDDRADSDAPEGPSARGHLGHEGEDGPATEPESWWGGGPGPVTGVGPTEPACELPAALAKMPACLEAGNNISCDQVESL